MICILFWYFMSFSFFGMSQKNLNELPNLNRVIYLELPSPSLPSLPLLRFTQAHLMLQGPLEGEVWSVESITVIPSRPVMHFSESVRFHYLTQIN